LVAVEWVVEMEMASVVEVAEVAEVMEVAGAEVVGCTRRECTRPS